MFGLTLLLAASPAAAQVLSPLHEKTDSHLQFMPRYAFHLAAEHLSSPDPRFDWDTNFGGEMDFVDYGWGRATFIANYQAILGEQLRAFDPNQGNYTLSGLFSARRRGIEVAAEFYHQSRHFSDRSKEIPVDWNMVGGRVNRSFELTGMSLDTRADFRKVVKKTTVDYSWELETNVHAKRPLHHSTSLVGDMTARILGVDGAQNRGTQHGYRGEAGMLFEGKAGAIELYMAGERRIDPYPLEFGNANWVSLGFRFLSR